MALAFEESQESGADLSGENRGGNIIDSAARFECARREIALAAFELAQYGPDHVAAETTALQKGH